MANQVIIDPRQALALSNYKSPNSETFGNLKQSMIKAGYSEVYASNVTGKKVEWLTDNTKRDVAMVTRAEKNLERYLNLDVKLHSKIGVDVAKLQADVSKFVLKTLARQKYSEDKDATPPQVQINIVNYNDEKPIAKDAETVGRQG